MAFRPLSHPYIIGLTGGIASGKSLAADYIQRTYAPTIFDADRLAREAVEPGKAIYKAILKRYGQDFTLADGTLNRQRLGERVFINADERVWLEQLIHPYVGDRLVALTQASQAPIIIWVVPLLFEAKMDAWVTEIWLVACDEARQQKRLMARDRLTVEAAQSRIDSQMPLADKIAQADQVLWNNGDPQELYAAIDQAWNALPSP